MIVKRRLVQVCLPFVATLGFAGGAAAYLTSLGSGLGPGGVAVTLSAVTATGGTATQSLLPTGSPTGDVAATLNNGNSSRVHVGSLSLDTSQGAGGFSSNAAGCALSFTTQTNSGNGWTISANGSVAVDLTGSVTMGTGAASTCQGQSFTVYLTAS